MSLRGDARYGLLVFFVLSPFLSLQGSAQTEPCPCWEIEDLRSAVATIPDPSNGDPGIGNCELSVEPIGGRLLARLVIQNQQGDRFTGAIAEFNATDQRCIVFDDGLDVGLVPIVEVGLSEPEVAACAASLGQVCRELLPEASGWLSQGLGVAMLAWLGRSVAHSSR